MAFCNSCITVPVLPVFALHAHEYVPAVAVRRAASPWNTLVAPAWSRRRAQQCTRPARALPRVVASTAVDTALPKELHKIVTAFAMVPDARAKYQQLLHFASKLPPLPAEDHTDDNKVTGCVSQVWVVGELRADGRVYWRADSDSALTKGLAALLVQGLSGATPSEIVAIPKDFMETMGLAQSLTPSRNNGFLNMFRLMQQKSLQLLAAQPAQPAAQPEAAAQADADRTSSSGRSTAAPAAPAAGPVSAGSQSHNGNGAATMAERQQAGAEASSSSGSASTGAAAVTGSRTPVRDSMERKLRDRLQPTKLVIEDESSRHAGHAGSRMTASASGETHFRMEIISAKFDGLSTVTRHRMVYKILDEELKGSVHALSLETKTPAETQ